MRDRCRCFIDSCRPAIGDNIIGDRLLSSFRGPRDDDCRHLCQRFSVSRAIWVSDDCSADQQLAPSPGDGCRRSDNAGSCSVGIRDIVRALKTIIGNLVIAVGNAAARRLQLMCRPLFLLLAMVLMASCCCPLAIAAPQRHDSVHPKQSESVTITAPAKSGHIPSKSGHGARILMDTTTTHAQLYPAFLKVAAHGSLDRVWSRHGSDDQHHGVWTRRGSDDRHRADGMVPRRRGRMVRALIGSSPPTCTSKCNKCTPCTPVRVPIHPGQKKIGLLEYYPEAWRCKCKNKLYMP